MKENEEDWGQAVSHPCAIHSNGKETAVEHAHTGACRHMPCKNMRDHMKSGTFFICDG
jgi:hypothetical protein